MMMYKATLMGFVFVLALLLAVPFPLLAQSSKDKDVKSKEVSRSFITMATRIIFN